MADLDLTKLDDDALWPQMHSVMALGAEAMDLHFRLFVPYVVGVYELVNACEELLEMRLPDVTCLLEGLSTTSSAPTRALAEVGARVRQSPEASAALNSPDAFERLSADPAVGEALRGWLRRWGLRTIGYDPGQPSFAERPSLVVGLLAELVDGAPEKDVQARRAEAVADARRRSPTRRWARAPLGRRAGAFDRRCL